MPELPEVETARQALEPGIIGRTVISVEVRHPKVIAHPSSEGFMERLPGQRFISTERRGKFLTFITEHGDRLTVHLRMTGCLLLTPTDYPEEPHTHIIIKLDDGSELRFSDTRRFGRMWLLDDKEEDITGIGNLGLEPFDSELTANFLKERLGSRKKAIKECLLDQCIIAGIGNIYSDEILFESGVNPARSAYSLSDDEWTRLARNIPNLMRFFLENNLVSPEEYLSKKGRDYRNTPHLKVYGHEGDPCVKCGTKLVRTTIGGRSSVYCPQCQI